jgi:hypothetical protein
MPDNLQLLPRLKFKRLRVLLNKLKRLRIKPIKHTRQPRPLLLLKKLSRQNLLQSKKLRPKLKR